jgi:hypothetical protein
LDAPLVCLEGPQWSVIVGSVVLNRAHVSSPHLPCSFVLFMQPNLASLDTLLLAEETKQLAEATFLKKQMYYHMRMKTVHRNARNIIKLAVQGKKVRAGGARCHLPDNALPQCCSV